MDDASSFGAFSEESRVDLTNIVGNDDLGITTLMVAATKRDCTFLLDLLSSGNAEAALFVKDSKGRTALVIFGSYDDCTTL